MRASPRSASRSSGWRQKGGPAVRTRAPAHTGDTGAGKDSVAVAGDRTGLCLGASGSPTAGEPGRGRRAGRAARVSGATQRDAERAGAARRVGLGGITLSQGNDELLAGAVSVLRDGGVAPDEQRSGAVFWVA